MAEPTVKPLASLAMAVMETGALADLPALSAPLVTVESLHPASKRLAETSAAGKTFNSDLNVMAIELSRPGRGVKAQRQALKKTARGCKAYRVCECQCFGLYYWSVPTQLKPLLPWIRLRPPAAPASGRGQCRGVRRTGLPGWLAARCIPCGFAHCPAPGGG